MFLKSTLSIVGTTLLASASYSQNFTYANVSVETATFDADLIIRKDDATLYTTPQWDKSAGTVNPVAYASGDVPEVSAELTIECPTVPDSVIIRGVGPVGILFPGVKVEVQPSGSDIPSMKLAVEMQTERILKLMLLQEFGLSSRIRFC